MSDATIGILFESRIKTWAESKNYPVAFANTDFDPSTQAIDGLYLEVFILPAKTVSQTLDAAHRGFRGVVQININVKRGSGNAVTRRITGELDALFPCALILTHTDGFKVQTVTPASVAAAVESVAKNFVPVSFNYEANTY